MTDVLENGIKLPQKGSRDWYTEASDNAHLIDNHLGDTDKHLSSDDREAIASIGTKATPQDILDAIALLVDNAPETLNTLGKIASELGNKQPTLTAQQLANIADVPNKAKATDLTTHTSNADIHVTTADKAKWDDVVNKANDNDVVHKSGDETISGDKTFTSSVKLKSNTIDNTVTPTTNQFKNLYITDKNDVNLGMLYYAQRTNNNRELNLQVYHPSNSEPLNLNLVHTGNTRGVVVQGEQFIPALNNTNLGTSTNKWKDVQTVLLNGKTPAYASDLSNYLPLSGGQLSGNICKTSDTSHLTLTGGTNYSSGASCVLCGKGEFDGRFDLRAFDGVKSSILRGQASGALQWGGKNIDVIEEHGNGYIRYSNGVQICWGLGIYSDDQVITYQKPFIENPSISLDNGYSRTTNWGKNNFTITIDSVSNQYICWQAIGKWK